MGLIKAKQIDIVTVINSITQYFNLASNPSNTDNIAKRNAFVQSIKAAPEFDEKVKADAADDTPANYLSQKITGDVGSDITIETEYDNTLKKVVVKGSIDPTNIANIIATKFENIFFEVPESEEVSSYTDSALINKTIIYVIREHNFMYEGEGSEDYQFNASLGSISFNTPVIQYERISILFI